MEHFCANEEEELLTEGASICQKLVTQVHCVSVAVGSLLLENHSNRQIHSAGVSVVEGASWDSTGHSPHCPGHPVPLFTVTRLLSEPLEQVALPHMQLVWLRACEHRSAASRRISTRKVKKRLQRGFELVGKMKEQMQFTECTVHTHSRSTISTFV